MAITTEKDAENKSTEMGRKNIVPYALYRAEGYISANLARKSTGFSEEDLELLWDAIINMFEIDHSAARGKMAVRRLIVFKHSKELGDCPAYKLFDAVVVKGMRMWSIPENTGITRLPSIGIRFRRQLKYRRRYNGIQRMTSSCCPVSSILSFAGASGPYTY